ncbi:hypothetical protein BLNAU_23683 [Blattamonas nauphoetae]|uniref:Uncharacterized protein n=1 Tax=Blattamonas nauphoetae TaxID=2049346 RepID=A0ABQ9WPJ8_9EUKA|nr:hypothetical protein BLNAU_23683 [Blattamonas nauphoetae]
MDNTTLRGQRGRGKRRGCCDDAVQRQTFLDLNAAVSYAGQHTKIFRTCLSFEQNRHSAVADWKDKKDEPRVKGERVGCGPILV